MGFLRISSVVVTLMLSGQLLAGEAPGSNINSAYRIQGDRAVAPIQVFDNGTNTYLQLRDPRYPPAVLLEDGRVVTFTSEPPYIVVSGVHDALVLRYGNRLATVRSFGARIKTSRVSAPLGKNVYYGLAEEPVPAASIAPVRETKSAPVAAPLVVAQSPVAPEPPAKAAIPAASPAPAGFTGTFIVEKGGAPTREAVRARASTPTIVTIDFHGNSTRMSTDEIVRLSDLTVEARLILVVRGGASKLDRMRRDEVKRQLGRLGVDSKRIRVETVRWLEGSVEVTGEDGE